MDQELRDYAPPAAEYTTPTPEPTPTPVPALAPEQIVGTYEMSGAGRPDPRLEIRLYHHGNTDLRDRVCRFLQSS